MPQRGSAASAAQVAPAAQAAPVAVAEDIPAGSGRRARAAGPDGPTERPPAATLRRPGSGSSRFALSNWRVRWRLGAVIALPTLIAAVLGGFFIYGNVNTWVANGRVQHLAQLNASVVKLTQSLEDERDLSAGYAANRNSSTTALKNAQAATDSATQTVESQASGVTTGAGFAAAAVQNLDTMLDNLRNLPSIRKSVSSSSFPAAQVIRVYTDNVIDTANAFSAASGSGANDVSLQANVITLGSLLRIENDLSVQRAVLYSALNSQADVLSPAELSALQQAQYQQTADRADFNASTTQAEQQALDNTVSGPQTDAARSELSIAESLAQGNSPLPLSKYDGGLTPQTWYANQSYTIGKTRDFANQLVSSITDRANALRSDATTNLVISALLALILLFLVVLISTLVARSLTRPLRKLRSDALDVAGHRLPEMVRRLSQSEGTEETVEIEPIGVTSTDEIGEVARAFDQVHREAVRLAADEAMLRGNLNAMFINLSRRSQSLIERQLSLIDSLEQSEQDSGRLSSLFRLDHLATRMRRNSENLLVLAGHEVSRRWTQPVPLVDVLRAAISEIEQYERVVLNVQPGIVVVGQAVNDVVHLVAEIVENATTFSPEDTQVYVSGQPLTSGGVLLDITDNGVGVSDQEMSHANWRLDNPPVVDVAVSRRMGLFVVGRLAARHGVRVRLRHAQAGGLTALIWLPDTVAAPEAAAPLGRLRRFEPDDYGAAPSLSAPTQAPSTAAGATTAARIPRFSPMSPPSAPPPSFTPAAGAQTPGSGTPAAGPPSSGSASSGSASSGSFGPGSFGPGVPSGQPAAFGMPPAGSPGSVTPGSGIPSAGTQGAGTQGAGTQGAGTQGAGTQGAGTPASGAPAAGAPGAGASAAGIAGAAAAAAAAGRGWDTSEPSKLPVRGSNGNARGAHGNPNGNADAPPLMGNGSPAPANGFVAPDGGTPGDRNTPGDSSIPGNGFAADPGIAPGHGTAPGNGSVAGNGNLAGNGNTAASGNVAATPSNGVGNTTPASSLAGEVADQAIPQGLTPPPAGPDQAAPGRSRMPSFGGPPSMPPSPIGSQNVHGGDGPSAGSPAANGGSPADNAAPSGQVTVPPSAAPDQRLPIFDSLESDGFRSSGKPASTPQPAPAGPQERAAPAGLDEQAEPAGPEAQAAPAAEPVAEEPSWTSPSDEGWRAAEALAVPSAGETTQAGLPKRVPRANLVPGSADGGSTETEAEVPARSPDAIRNRMASFQRGVRQGRAATPQIEEPQDR
jgi:signal transduction histidine kinase